MDGQAIQLRLVGDAAAARPGGRPAADRRDAVGDENRAAALAADDVRALFASQVQANLEGGRAALLRPENRRRLVAIAVRQGLRPFDAHLIIAVVQDAARRGEQLDGEPVQGLLGAVSGPESASAGVLRWSIAAALLTVALLAGLFAWISGG